MKLELFTDIIGYLEANSPASELGFKNLGINSRWDGYEAWFMRQAAADRIEHGVQVSTSDDPSRYIVGLSIAASGPKNLTNRSFNMFELTDETALRNHLGEIQISFTEALNTTLQLTESDLDRDHVPTFFRQI